MPVEQYSFAGVVAGGDSYTLGRLPTLCCSTRLAWSSQAHARSREDWLRFWSPSGGKGVARETVHKAASALAPERGEPRDRFTFLGLQS